jgi:hypothetical protein
MDHQRIKSNRSDDSFLNLFTFSNSINRMFKGTDSEEGRLSGLLFTNPSNRQIGTFSFEKQYLASSSNNRSARKIDCPPNIFISDFEDKPVSNSGANHPKLSAFPCKSSKNNILGKRPPCLKQEYIENETAKLDTRRGLGRQPTKDCELGTGILIRDSGSTEFVSDSEEQSRQLVRLEKEELLAAQSAPMEFGLAKMDAEESQQWTVNLKGILDYHIDEVKLLAERGKKSYVCKYCAEVFGSGCALGGHISKIHRGINREYGRKIKLREEKKIERQRNAYLRKMGD